MKLRLLYWSLLAGVVAIGVFGYSQLVAANAQATTPGRIVASRVRGKIEALATATQVRTVIQSGSEVGHGTVVTTGAGSGVVLVFSNGAQISLEANSELRIEQFTQDPLATAFSPDTAIQEPNRSNTVLKLVRGEFTGKVPRLRIAEGSTFTVETPAGVAKLRSNSEIFGYNSERLGRPAFTQIDADGRVESMLPPALAK